MAERPGIKRLSAGHIATNPFVGEKHALQEKVEPFFRFVYRRVLINGHNPVLYRLDKNLEARIPADERSSFLELPELDEFVGQAVSYHSNTGNLYRVEITGYMRDTCRFVSTLPELRVGK